MSWTFTPTKSPAQGSQLQYDFEPSPCPATIGHHVVQRSSAPSCKESNKCQ